MDCGNCSRLRDALVLAAITIACLILAGTAKGEVVELRQSLGKGKVGVAQAVPFAIGRAITVKHAVDHGDRATVVWSGGRTEARVTHRDPQRDIAVIKYDADIPKERFANENAVSGTDIYWIVGREGHKSGKVLSYRSGEMVVSRRCSRLKSNSYSGGPGYDSSGNVLAIHSCCSERDSIWMPIGLIKHLITPKKYTRSRADVERPIIIVFTSPGCGPCNAFWKDWKENRLGLRERVLAKFRLQHYSTTSPPLANYRLGDRGVPQFWIEREPAPFAIGYAGVEDFLRKLEARSSSWVVETPQPTPSPEVLPETQAPATPSTGTPSIEDNPNKEPPPGTVTQKQKPIPKESSNASRPVEDVKKSSKVKKVAGVAAKGLSLATKLGLLGGTGGTVAMALGVLGWWRRRRAAKEEAKVDNTVSAWGVPIPQPPAEEVDQYSGPVVQRDGSDKIILPREEPEEDASLLLDLYREVVEKIASGDNKDAVARSVGQQQLNYVAERFARLRKVIK